MGLGACSDGGQASREAVVYDAAPPAKGAAFAAQATAAEDDHGLSAMLAYEHHAGIQLPAGEIPARLEQVQAACADARFGACVVLAVNQQGGERPSASATLRIVPEGVEPMIALAGDGARLGSRSTHAEDLAVAVRDNAATRDRLAREMERLQQFQQRPDLSVSDMISLSERIAAVEAQLESAARQDAQYRRRIDTQRLTLSFQPPTGEAGRSEIGQALRDVAGVFSTGAAWTIRTMAFLAPLVLVLAVAVALIRLVRRRRRTRAQGAGTAAG
nr:hypothetical protein BGP89_08240 [Luteimonas sp. JM171]